MDAEAATAVDVALVGDAATAVDVASAADMDSVEEAVSDNFTRQFRGRFPVTGAGLATCCGQGFRLSPQPLARFGRAPMWCRDAHDRPRRTATAEKGPSTWVTTGNGALRKALREAPLSTRSALPGLPCRGIEYSPRITALQCTMSEESCVLREA